jgi:hypothetical protein
MGLGELALHYIYWRLTSLSTGGILLIEEPENRISAKSQTALLNLISKFSVTKKLWVILTTHSPIILSYFPSEHIRVLSRTGESVLVIDLPNDLHLRTILASSKRYSGMLLVEDEAAASFARAWLADKDSAMLNNLEIVVSGSNGDIVSAIKKTPYNSTWFTLAGLFDADQRSEQAQISDHHWGWAFLPGIASPEVELLQYKEAATEDLAKRSQLPVDDVRFIISSLAGQNHHDVFRELASFLRISIDHLAETLYEFWIADPANVESSNAAIINLHEALSTRNGPRVEVPQNINSSPLNT